MISKAFATTDSALDAVTTAAAPSAGEAVMMNLLLILIMVVLFYMLLIVPQQKRFKKHREMIESLKKGDKVVVSGGLVGVIEKIDADKNEVIVDLGNDMKVTALRSTVQLRQEQAALAATNKQAKK